MRVVRRPRGQPARQKALVAASAPITDVSAAFKGTTSMTVGRDEWQHRAWHMLDMVGELRYFVGWLSASCSRVKLIASELDDEGLPTGECEDDNVKEIVKAIAGGRLGQAQYIRRGAECLAVAGEFYTAIVMGLPEDIFGAGTWFALSRDELKTKGKIASIEMPDGTWRDLNFGAGDSLFRTWRSHPRRASKPDSPVRSCLDPLDEIVRTTKTISNASKSRLIGNGIVLVPHEMSLPTQATPVSAGKPGDAVPPIIGQPAVQQLQELLFQVAQTAYDDEDSMAALIPIFAGVPGDQVKNISHVKFDNEVTQLAIQTRNDAIARLAMGLDVSPERLLGLGANTNHWSAWQIGDTDVQLHIAPVMELICQFITKDIMRTVFARNGIDPTKYVLWYDTGGLTSDPDKSDQATNAFDRGAITAEAYREFLNLGDSGYDFSTLEGWQQWATDKVSEDPAQLLSLLPLLPTNIQGLDFPEPPPAIAPAAPDTPNEGDTNPDGSPGSENDPPPSERETRSVVDGVEMSVVEQLLVHRALELAGKRRVNTHDRGQQDRLRGRSPHEYHRFMPPVREDDIPKLIKGWDTAADDVISRLGIEAEDMKARVRAEVRRQLTTQVVDA